mgnify:CR=1 FL=1
MAINISGHIDYILLFHPKKGFELLKTLDLDERILFSTLAHHERCDGSGYPLKLHNAQINDFAKIISIADVYDAMTAARVYRAPVCPFKVISIFETEGYSLYDPKYLLPFCKFFRLCENFFRNQKLSNIM